VEPLKMPFEGANLHVFKLQWKQSDLFVVFIRKKTPQRENPLWCNL